MKLYKKETVLEAARKRIAWLFDEFEHIICSMSGGKDSAVVFHLTMNEAKKRGRLPLPVLWLDQESEWQGTVDYMKSIMSRDDVKPYWIQIPMVISNNASAKERFVYCWDESKKDKWMHSKDPLAIHHVEGLSSNRFHTLFTSLLQKFFSRDACYITGMRCEESPKRANIMTAVEAYKGETWGRKNNPKKRLYSMHPCYDWKTSDIWCYIHKNKIPYNRVYDLMYQHGVPLSKMRVSNLHHETALQSLLLVQKIEPETWERIVERIDGAETVKQLKGKAFKCPKELPYMFSSWKEYATFLIDKLGNPDEVGKFMVKMRWWGKTFDGSRGEGPYYRAVIGAILSADYDGSKIDNFGSQPQAFLYRRFKHGETVEMRAGESTSAYKYFSEEDLKENERRLKNAQ